MSAVDFSLPENNPLLRPSTLPYGILPLDQVKPEHWLPAMQVVVADAQAQINAIKTNTDPATFQNTIEALELAQVKPGNIYSPFYNISWANSNDGIRAVEAGMAALDSDLRSGIYLDKELFDRVKEVYQQKDTLGLDAQESRLLEVTYKRFVDNGADLETAEQRDMLRDIDKRLAELSTKFNSNLVEARKAYFRVVENEEELIGLSDDTKKSMKDASRKAYNDAVKEALKGAAKQAFNRAQSGEVFADALEEESAAVSDETLTALAEKFGYPDKWLIRLSASDQIYQSCQNRALREEIYRADYAAAYKDQFDNCPIVMEMAKLRHERAQLLGCNNFAEMILRGEMAGNPETVLNMMAENLKIYRPAAEKDMADLKEIAHKLDGLDDLKPWDIPYYAEKIKSERYSIDDETVKPYFELNAVFKGFCQHMEKLFNVDIVPTEGKYPMYHPEVKVYEIYDKADGQILGLYCTDYTLRDGSLPGDGDKLTDAAWATVLRQGGLEVDGKVLPVVVNVCDFERATADRPTLLTKHQVKTVFHEGGHGFHGLLSKVKYKSIAGMNVKRDFVEFPSQVQENWADEKEVINTFARHYKTGEKIPEDLLDKIAAADNYGAGLLGLRHTFQSLLDMKWHMTDPAKIGSVEELEDSVVNNVLLSPRVVSPRSTSFDHIWVGTDYAAGYYQYKWAEVSDADAFVPFKQRGLYDPELSAKLKTIYESGNLKDPMELYVAFRGAEPDPTALFRRQGLLPPAGGSSSQPVVNPSAKS